MQNPRYPGYPWVHPTPTFLQPRESSTCTSIDVVAHFARWNGVEGEEKEEEEWVTLSSHASIRTRHSSSVLVITCIPLVHSPVPRLSVLVVAWVCTRAHCCSHSSICARTCCCSSPAAVCARHHWSLGGGEGRRSGGGGGGVRALIPTQSILDTS